MEFKKGNRNYILSNIAKFLYQSNSDKSILRKEQLNDSFSFSRLAEVREEFLGNEFNSRFFINRDTDIFLRKTHSSLSNQTNSEKSGKNFLLLASQDQEKLLNDFQKTVQNKPHGANFLGYKLIVLDHGLDDHDIQDINRLNPDFIFVSGNGCRLSNWLERNKGKLNTEPTILQYDLSSYLESLNARDNIEICTPGYSVSRLQVQSSNSSYMEKIQNWIENRDSRSVSCIDTRVLAEIVQDEGFAKSFIETNKMDLFLPCGTPVQWLLKKEESVDTLVNELTLFKEIIQFCVENRKRVTLVGDDRNILEKLVHRLSLLEFGLDMDLLHWVHLENPQNLSKNEHNDIQNSQPDIVLLSLPHPIQERWLVDHYHKLDITVVGVSDAFQLYSGSIFNPPKFIQKMGFEWLFHLVANPKRLGPHYFKAIPSFIFETGFITSNREVKILLQQIRESLEIKIT